MANEAQSVGGNAQTGARDALARNPIAVECALAVGGLTNADCDVVVFEDTRAFRVASTQTTVLQPRHLLSCERELLASDSEFVVGQDGIAYAIRDQFGQLVGAMSALAVDADLVDVDALRPIARMLTIVVASATDRNASPDELPMAILDGLRDVVVVLSQDLTVKWVNQAVGSLFGRTAAEIVGQSAIGLLHPDDVSVAADAIVRLRQGLELYRVFVRLMHGNGTYVRVEVTGVDQSSHPVLLGTVVSLRLDNAETELTARAERTTLMSDAIVAGLNDGIVATDQFGAITMVNDVARAIFDLDPSVAPARLTLADFALSDPAGHPITFRVGSMAAQAEPAEGHVVSSRGAVRVVLGHQQPVLSAAGGLLGSVIAFHDVTEARQAADLLRQQALHDQLTGLANRRQLEDRLAALAGLETDSQVAACFIDLDGFKLVNDIHGHRVGDELIRIAAKRLHAALRADDLLVRQGGDEFVALLAGVNDQAEAVATAERLRGTLARPYLLGPDRFDLTASIGVALSSTRSLRNPVLLRQADTALYAAKSAGKNQIAVFDRQLAVAARLEERQRRMLRQALDEDRLVMHFQPLVNATTGRTTGYEALARCLNDEDELIGPPEFMDAIANSALMWDLDRAAFSQSCRAAAVLATHAPAHSPPTVACNFSAISVSKGKLLVSFVTETIAAAAIEPEQICIEVTETSALEAGAHTLETLQALHDHGLQLALDDFGTGYSSLAHLRDLPLTAVKIDRTYIARLGQESPERSIAAAVVNLASDLGIEAIAEGVENTAELALAQRLGFSTIQGWHYARAMPLDEILETWVNLD